MGASTHLQVSEVSEVQAPLYAVSRDTQVVFPKVAEVSKPMEQGGIDQPRIIPTETDRPCFRVIDEYLKEDGQTYRPGVWHFGLKAGKNDAPPAPTQQWICSPLHIDAVTTDAHAGNFGRLLRFKTTLGKWRTWAMPMELLRSDGSDLRGELLAMGVEIDPQARNMLAMYLQGKAPNRRIQCALHTGWAGTDYQAFVLPDEVIGPKAASVVYQSGDRGQEEYTMSGTLVGWQEGVAAMAVGNPLLTLALSVSFAGPMLARCNAEGGGVHFVGDSSTGKTTALNAGCATWGGPNFRRSWRTTANGMEGAAALSNDCLLALDEISECAPHDVGAIVYSLGNGRGKQRASRTGSARPVTRWRCVILSSGERTIATSMAEAGHQAKAGQAVRMLDIPAARNYGAWDNLHDLPSGAAFSDVVNRAAATHYGHAGRAFLEKLTRDRRDFCALWERTKALPGFGAEGGEGQDKRAAGRFALFALAGEVATEYGLTGWPEGAAIKAAQESYKAWRSLRGHGSNERRQILEQVFGFIERHGDARFSDVDAQGETSVRERAGWWRNTSDGRHFLFTASGMREALKGFDFHRALDILQEAGMLPAPGSDGKRAKFYRVGGRGMKLYPIHTEKREDDHGA